MNRLFIALLCWLASPFAWAHLSFEDKVQREVAQGRIAFVQVYGHKKVAAPRIEAVSRQLQMHDVQLLVLKDSPFGIGSYVPGIVVLDASMESESPEAIAFVLAHEYGHHTAQHWYGLVKHAAALAQVHGDDEPLELMQRVVGTRPKSEAHQHEFEADRLAKERMQRFGLWSDDGVSDFVRRKMWKSETATHPESLARLRALDLAE